MDRWILPQFTTMLYNMTLILQLKVPTFFLRYWEPIKCEYFMLMEVYVSPLMETPVFRNFRGLGGGGLVLTKKILLNDFCYLQLNGHYGPSAHFIHSMNNVIYHM